MIRAGKTDSGKYWNIVVKLVYYTDNLATFDDKIKKKIVQIDHSKTMYWKYEIKRKADNVNIANV